MKLSKETLEKIKKIPPGSIGIQCNGGIIETGIKLFFFIRLALSMVAKKKINIGKVYTFVRTLFKTKPNHCFTYWHANETIDAMPGGIEKHSLIKKLKKGSKIKIYFNKHITVKGIQAGKVYSYGMLGTKYSYQDFLKFVTDLLETIIPEFPVHLENSKLHHCSENAVRTQDVMLTMHATKLSPKILPKIKPRDRVHPQHVENFLSSAAARKLGWIKVFDNTKK